MDLLLSNLLEAVSDVLTAGELDDGGTFVCADEDAQRLQAAYTAYIAVTQPTDPLVHEYRTLVASLEEEFGPDAERKAQEAFFGVRGDVLRDVRFAAVEVPDDDFYTAADAEADYLGSLGPGESTLQSMSEQSLLASRDQEARL